MPRLVKFQQAIAERDPLLASLRDDPRFSALAEKARLRWEAYRAWATRHLPGKKAGESSPAGILRLLLPQRRQIFDEIDQLLLRHLLIQIGRHHRMMQVRDGRDVDSVISLY